MVNQELTEEVIKAIKSYYKKGSRQVETICHIEVDDKNTIFLHCNSPEFVIETNGIGVKDLASFLNRSLSIEFRVQVVQWELFN